MTDLNSNLNLCEDHLKHMNNLQVFLISGSCPEHLLQSILDYQMHLIEVLSLQLSMAYAHPSFEFLAPSFEIQ